MQIELTVASESQLLLPVVLDALHFKVHRWWDESMICATTTVGQKGSIERDESRIIGSFRFVPTVPGRRKKKHFSLLFLLLLITDEVERTKKKKNSLRFRKIERKKGMN